MGYYAVSRKAKVFNANVVTLIVSKLPRQLAWCVVVAIFHAFTVLALVRSGWKAVFPLILLLGGYIYFITYFFESSIGKIYENAKRVIIDFYKSSRFLQKWSGWIPGLGCIVFYILVITWIIFDGIATSSLLIRLRSLISLPILVLIGIMFSANPAKIKWRPVIGGLVVQLGVGLIVLRWEPGLNGLQWFSDQVVTFLDYSTNATSFVYGFAAAPPNICGMNGAFIFTALQIIIYFSGIVAFLYHIGILEWLLVRVAIVMQNTLGTTAAESLNAAACIFLGQTEAAVLIEPALSTMTESEIHTVMSAGFACIAGSLFSAYISFGACPLYLLSASVMSAAVSIAISKVIYPEIQVSRQKDISSFSFKARYSSVLNALSSGAVHAVWFVLSIAANLLVYIAILALINSSLSYLGDCVGYPELSMNKILGYCFYPIAFIMGASDASDAVVNSRETMLVAELLGIKTVLNEFIAYQRLAQLVATGELTGARARMIATYALCGFSNIGMIGSQLGVLGSMCPQRKRIFAKVVLRALVSGILSCLLTASVAGALVSNPFACPPHTMASCFDPNKAIFPRNITL